MTISWWHAEDQYFSREMLSFSPLSLAPCFRSYVAYIISRNKSTAEVTSASSSSLSLLPFPPPSRDYVSVLPPAMSVIQGQCKRPTILAAHNLSKPGPLYQCMSRRFAVTLQRHDRCCLESNASILNTQLPTKSCTKQITYSFYMLPVTTQPL